MATTYCKKADVPTEIFGFKIPFGAIYGRCGADFFVCTKFDPDAKTVKIFANGKSRIWHKDTICRADYRCKLIAEAAKAPIVKRHCEKCTKPERIPWLPVMRKVNYNFTPSGMTTHSLIKQCFDNADHSGGGSNVQNENSYWAIYKDMPRRYVKYN